MQARRLPHSMKEPVKKYVIAMTNLGVGHLLK